MTPEEVRQIICEGLSLNVVTRESYTGGMNGGPLYENVISIQLLFDGQVLSEEYL